MPIIVAVANPFFIFLLFGSLEPWGVREPGGDWVRLLRDLPGGGAVYGGGGGAGLLSNEFPLYLFYSNDMLAT